MLKQILGFSSVPRALTTALLVVLGACNPTETRSSGHLEILPDRSAEASCDMAVPGQLRLAGVVDASVSFVSGEQLCKSALVRRELPAGLYSVAWEPSSGSGSADSGDAWALSGPSVFSIFPERVTRLLVHQATPDRVLASSVP